MEKFVYIAGRDQVPGQITLSAGQRMAVTVVVLPGADFDMSLDVDICGPDAEFDFAALYLANGSQKVRFSIDLHHSAGGSRSRQLIKGIAAGASSAEFSGRIYVAQDAQQTKAYQENHNILTSERATVETRPQLEIYADDVECSHGATTGSLNAEEQFYMRSRGIPEDQAEMLQMISFLAPVVERLPENLAQQVYDNLSECQA